MEIELANYRQGLRLFLYETLSGIFVFIVS